MKAIDAAELSAYLDGELDPPRRAEVEKALASDAALRAEFEQLRLHYAVWAAAASSAISEPAKHTSSFAIDFRIIIGIVLLLALRFLPKLGDLVFWGIVIHAVALVVVLTSIARMIRMDALAMER